MKHLVPVLALSAVSAASAVTLSIDSVKQRWPFSPKIDITFTVGETGGDFYRLKDFAIYDGNHQVALNGTAAFDNLKPVYSAGTYTLTFDPSKTALTNIVAVQHFRIGFDISATPTRYLIVNLDKQVDEDGLVEYIDQGDPRLETFVQTVVYLDNGTPTQTTIQYSDAFLSLTNMTVSSGGKTASPYAINKMAFRLVKPGDYRVGKASVSSTYNSVTFTKPYFIAVGLLSRGQYGYIRYGSPWQTDTGTDGNAENQSKSKEIYLDDLRGPHNDPVYPVDWITYGHSVCPTSFIGQARIKYGLAFDQPTEAQWEVAARAGTTGFYYVDVNLTAENTDLLLKLGHEGGTNFNPFRKLANGWGLFDLLGWGQGVLDNAKSSDAGQVNNWVWPSGTDPVGAYTTWNGFCICKGGGHHAGLLEACGSRPTGLSRTKYVNWYDGGYNRVRLVINVD